MSSIVVTVIAGFQCFFFTNVGLPVLLTEQEEAVLAGSAILAAAAAGDQVTST